MAKNEKKINWSDWYARTAVVLLVAACISLVYANNEQAVIIQSQKATIRVVDHLVVLLLKICAMAQ